MNALHGPSRLAIQWSLCLLLSACVLFPAAASAQDSAFEQIQKKYDSIKWEHGPTTSQISNMAEIKVPEGYKFTGRAGAQIVNELGQNPPDPSLLGVLSPESGEWDVYFAFSDVGYVKDDEQASLDADALIRDLRAGNEASNRQRKARGWPELQIVDWLQKPAYDTKYNRLIWGILLRSEGRDNANVDIRLLGRKGYMTATLVCEVDSTTQLVPVVNEVLDGFDFTSGNKYAEWRAGDKVAEYGLAGLITGGAVVAAAKTGLLSKLGSFVKLIVLGAIALLGGLWKLITGRSRESAA